MGRLRRGATALCAAFVLVATGAVTLDQQAANDSTTSGPAAAATRRDTAPTIVPGRYLVQVEPSARARVRSAAERAGATVNDSYDTLWSGLSVTATDAQLQQIRSAAGVASVFPVYQLHLDDDPVTYSEDEPDPSDPPSTEPTDPTTEPTDPTTEPTDPTTEPTDPTTEPTDPTTEPTDPTTEPTDPTTEPTDPTTEPTVVLPDRSETVAYLESATLHVLDDDGSWDPSSLRLLGDGASEDGKILTVAGRGSFGVNADGTISFASIAGWAGVMEPVSYQVTNSDHETATGTITMTVTAPEGPTAVDDTASGVVGAPVVVDVLDNDDAHGNASLQSGTLEVAVGTDEWSGTAHTDAGDWVVSDGLITFTPADGFTGTTTIAYRVADELHRTATANVAVTIHPVASDHAVTTPYLTPVTVPLLDDQPGGAVTLDPASLVLRDGDGQWVTTLSVPDQGEYATNPDGSVTFTPVRGYRGDAPPVTYRFTDNLGQNTTATLRVTVASPEAPTARDDETTAVAGTLVRVEVLANDTAGGLARLQTDSVCLVAGTTCVTSVTDDDGTWRITDSGAVEFTPLADRAVKAAISYRVSDELGQAGTAAIRVDVRTSPRAVDDDAHTPYRTPVNPNVLVLANDVPGSDATGPGHFEPATLTLVGAGTSADGKTRTTSAGTWQVTSVGALAFAPAPGFWGTAQSDYTVKDSFGHEARATLRVKVGKPPHAEPDTGTTKQNRPVPLTPLANDTPGDDGDGTVGTLDTSSLRFTASAATDNGKKLVVPGEGAYAIADTGSVTFTPEVSFTGKATPVSYAVTDSFGNTATATITITVVAVVPTAASDPGNHGPANHQVSVSPLTNDHEGDPTAPLDPATLSFSGAGTSADGKTRTTSAGSWQARPDGTVVFTPATGVTGTTSTDYRVLDANGTPALTENHVLPTITVTIGALPQASDDTVVTRQNVPITLDPLANDVGGDDGTGNATRDKLDPRSLVFTNTSPGTAGTWTIDPGTGQVTFTPTTVFTGSAAATYRVTDRYGNTATATIAITVAAVVPIAVDDTGHGPANHAVTVTPLANDRAGDVSAPLDPVSVTLTGAGASTDGKTRTTADGTWKANPNGTVVFTPTSSFTGTTSTSYRVLDRNGTPALATGNLLPTVTIRIGAPTTATDYTASTPQNVTVTVVPLNNVKVGDDGAGIPGTLVTSSMVFTAANAMDSGRTLVVQNDGTWRIDAATGKVTFDPESAFTGTTSATYRIADSFGNTVTAKVSVVVTPIVPRAVADYGHTAANNPMTINVLGNDVAGAASAPLKPETLQLASTSSNAGTWRLNSDRSVTFTPNRNFTGAATTQYQIRDGNNTSAAATITIQVGALPTAKADSTSAPQDGRTVTIDPVANDTAGDDGTGAGRSFVRSSLTFTNGNATAGGKALSTASYAWSVGGDGKVSFTPNWRFTGNAAVSYQITDTYGNSASASISVTVTPTAPTATEQRLSSIGALQATQDGSGIKVGIIDSGVDYDHPDLGGSPGAAFPTSRFAKGYDYVDRNGNPVDCYGHGTKVAGILGANGNPKLGGAYGVAPKVTFGAYRVFDCQGNGTTDNIVKAMERAATDGMNVVNLSLGVSSSSWPDDPLSQAAANLVKRGVVVVAAAGNAGDKGLFTAGSPGVAPGVISLAAANAGSTGIESYSAMGLAADLSLSPTLTAPGSTVHTTALGNAYADPTGTSMAAPEVAGAVARILQAKGWKAPAAGVPAKVTALLYASATTLNSTTSGVSGKPDAVFRQGAGLVQLQQAVNQSVTAAPSTLKLGEGTSVTKTITLANTSKGSITYQVGATTGASAAASTGSRTDAGNQTPSWGYAAVGFKATPAKVTVPAGGTATVKVKITAPSKLLSGKQGMLYGGWVRFSAAGQQTVSVPFAGVRGDYQKVRLLPKAGRSFVDSSTGLSYSYTLPALAYLTSGSALQPTYSGTRTFHVSKSGGQPYVMFHLDYPTSGIRLKATNQKTKKSYYAVLSGTSTQLGKQGRDESYTALPFYGAYKNSKGKVVAVAAGTYKLQLRVLKPLGNSKKSSAWETYTTRAFKLTWS